MLTMRITVKTLSELLADYEKSAKYTQPFLFKDIEWLIK